MPIRLSKLAPIIVSPASILPNARSNFSAAQTAESGEAITASTLHHTQTVFVIVMENHNWTGSAPLNIKGNPAAPHFN